MARQLFLTLGIEAYEPPGTLAKSRDAAADALQRRGLDFPELHLDNGAGLSRDTRISAEHLGVILQQAATSPWSAEYVSSLSLAGLDGTVRKRFTEEEATGRMHLKTGRLQDVFATAGYVHARSGHEYVVVVLQNFRGADDGPGEEVQAALLRWVYQQ
jgi:D-alanyl-D-alanine carboxypeptidase/D-alanyl-D-alanine-endopeptidase (penicillin-binding protein 4)